MWWPTRHGRVEGWDLPNCWHLRPRGRLALFEERWATAGPTPCRWTFGAGCGTTTPPASPPPPPDPISSATWREVAAEVHAPLPRLIDVFWATLPEASDVWATARWPNGELLHEVAREPNRPAEGWEHIRPSRTPTPPLPPATPHPLHATPSTPRRAHLGP